MLATLLLVPLGLPHSGPDPWDLFVDAAASCASADGSETAPFCTLGEALSAAVSGDVIRIAAGTYEENVSVPMDVHLVGTGGAANTIIDGMRLDTVMRILPGANVVVDGLTITKGQGQPGGILNDGSLTLRNSTVHSNFYAGNAQGGGGIYHTQQARDLTLRNCTISANADTNFAHFGGGLLAYGTGTVTIEDTLFDGNRSPYSSGISISSPIVRMDGVTLTDNRGYGAAGFVQSGDATIRNTTIARNFGSGLKVAPLPGSPTRIDHCTLARNYVGMYALSEYETALTVDALFGDVILSNTVVVGSSLYAYQGSIVGAPLSGGNNFIAKIKSPHAPAFQDGVNGDRVGPYPAGLDPKLRRAVRDHGGVTPTMLPRRDSPLIGAGSVATAMGADQRGLPWGPLASDIGAARYSFEAAPMECIAESNSTGFPGDLYATGSQLAFDNGLDLTLTMLPPGQLAVVLVSPAVGITPFPAGSDGILCLAGPIGRLLGPGQIVTASAAGTASLSVDLRALPTVPGPMIEVTAGTTLVFQAWHRDQALGSPTSNFTGAASVNFR